MQLVEKSLDFINSELAKGQDIELLVKTKGGPETSHWVTVIGLGVNGDRVFLEVNDPDDKKTGAVEWEFDKAGNVVKGPAGTEYIRWAVAESFVPEPSTLLLLTCPVACMSLERCARQNLAVPKPPDDKSVALLQLVWVRNQQLR